MSRVTVGPTTVSEGLRGARDGDGHGDGDGDGHGDGDGEGHSVTSTAQQLHGLP